MIKIKNYVTFISDFFDEFMDIENADKTPVGYALANAISNRIPSANTPFQHSYYGWQFSFESFHGEKAWLTLQQPGPWLIIVEAKTLWFDKKECKLTKHQSAIAVVGKALNDMPEISDITWLTREEFVMQQRQKRGT